MNTVEILCQSRLKLRPLEIHDIRYGNKEDKGSFACA